MARLTAEKFNKKLTRLAKKAPAAAVKGLKEGTRIILQDSKRKHMSGPRMPVGVGSMVNPTIDSKGRMRSQLKSTVKRRPGKKEVYANVRSTNGLSKILHDGGTLHRGGKGFVFQLPGQTKWIRTDRIEFPKRPFLKVSVEKKRKKVIEIIKKVWIKEYKK